MPLTPVRRDFEAEGEPKHPVISALADMREGFVYMVRTPWLLATLLFASLMILVMMGPLEVLIPFLIKDGLGGGPGDHALVLAAFGIGGAVGSLAMASFKMPRRYLTLMNLMWGVGCLPFLAIGFATAVWQIVVAAFVLGALFSAPMVIWGTLLQRRVPPHMLGRVASLDFFVSISLMPVSMALAGPVAEAIGLRATFADRRHRAGRLRDHRRAVGQAAAGRARPTRSATTMRSPNRPSPCRPSVSCAAGSRPGSGRAPSPRRRSGPTPWSRPGRRRRRPWPSASPGHR